LLAMMVVFDLATSRVWVQASWLRQALAGLILGGLCIGLMVASFRLENGIIFDTRSVLLSLSGLFLGIVPTVLAMATAAAYRLWLGGAGIWTGVSVIVATGTIGIVWRRYRPQQLTDISMPELYGFGIVVHLVMLALMLTLPGDAGYRVLQGLWLPVLLIYPIATIALGWLLVARLQRENIGNALAVSEERYRSVFEAANVGKVLIQPGGELEVNQAFCDLLGLRPKQLRGKRWQDLVPTEEVGLINERLSALLQGKANTVRFEHRYLHSDGSHIWVDFSATLLRDGKGKAVHFIGTVVDITDRKRLDGAIHRLAYYDPLTHLPNRRLFQDRLEHAIAGTRRSGLHGALVFLDIDNFKDLNDTRGHDVGDQLLVEIGQRIRALSREADTAARLGGDEFVVMLEDLSATDEDAALRARHIAEKILLGLAVPYDLDGGEYRCSASLGIALFNGQTGPVENLLKQADLAMYKAKDAGRNTFRFFDPAMQTALDERTAMESDLRSAMELNQLTVHYQPQIDCQSRALGAEVLLRWQHPQRGMVPPDEFIPLAEAGGLILPIGRWVLQVACRQLAAWSGHASRRELKLAVNVSAREFREAGFVDQVKTVLAETGADPSRLSLELTESMVLDDVSGALEKMNALKELGIGFALDDFGTGHSSLSYLTRLPLRTLKIDRSFVFNLPDSHNDAVIAQTIMSMARSLGLKVIAEGVETEAQRDFLSRHHCQAFQGYLFSRPLPLEEFEQYCAMHSGK
ncbi:MAG: EAL domain-containing protein, partial [Desulfuromonadales bacterium]|nr:EAL domain-containing protein [Desulfuromonadales bacterium]